MKLPPKVSGPFHRSRSIFFPLRYELQVSDGIFQSQRPRPSGWTHMVLNYFGPDGGTKLYFNGVYQSSNIPKFGAGIDPGDGRTVVGRKNADSDYYYSSLEIDELALFNNTLSDVQIGELFNSL